jgi:hypothetical protein
MGRKAYGRFGTRELGLVNNMAHFSEIASSATILQRVGESNVDISIYGLFLLFAGLFNQVSH